MSADILDRLAAADPAADMPILQPARRMSACCAGSSPRRWTRAAPRLADEDTHRLVALLGAALLFVGGAAAYGTEYGLPPLATSDDLDGDAGSRPVTSTTSGRRRPSCPPDMSWHEFERPWDDVTSAMEPAMGRDAVEQAIGRWAQEWIAAAKDRDPQRAAAAQAWLRRLRAAMQPIREGTSENGAGRTNILDDLDAAIAAASRGG